MRNSNFM